MYIIKSWDDGGTLYWTGNKFGWSVLRDRAHTYKTAKGACSALIRNKSKRRDSGQRSDKPWTAAQVVPTIGDRF